MIMVEQQTSIEKVHVHLEDRSYDIYIAPGLFGGPENAAIAALHRLVENRSVLIVADTNTASLTGEEMRRLIENLSASFCVLHTFPAGESSKNFKTVEAICRAAANARLDRNGLMIALGGGVTGDMAGFAASIYMRGIAFIQIPTSLLAMIDSSVGGKTGADLPEGKNLIGTFFQPKLVLMDVQFLKTLPADQLRSGYAELIKHAVLFDPELFMFLTDQAGK